MKTKITTCAFILMFSITFSQTTSQFTISNGDGWYRILEGTSQTSGLVKISGLTGSNRFTNLTMHVSLMAYGQGGVINIVNNSFYNSNHIKEIRGGTSNGKYVLDIYLEGINNPTNIKITTDTGIALLNSLIYNPIDDISGKIEISGKVIGTNSTRYPLYFSPNVGIGTSNPNASLEINSPSDTDDSDLLVYSSSTSTNLAGWSRISLKRINEADEGFLSFYGNQTSGLILGVSGNNPIRFYSNDTEKMKILSNGNVGIGTTNPGIWKLAVNGNIRAKEVKVETGWSDFVFENDYELPTLTEVESHIKQKGHLKDIPSATEVAKNGIFLGEMDAKLLQKIEELTLYTIQQEKEIKALKKQALEIEVLKKENKELKSIAERLAKIEEQLKPKD